jgi:hypothetical protein
LFVLCRIVVWNGAYGKRELAEQPYLLWVVDVKDGWKDYG